MIENQKVVSLTYEMYLEGENGQEELIEQMGEQSPLVYCHGEGMMLESFEAKLAGKEVGEEFDFFLTPDEAYGDYDEDGVRDLPKTLFHNADGAFDEERVYVGAIVPMQTTDGQIIRAQIAEIGDETVTIDLNHPYAGETLHFKGKIIDLRDATEAELDAIRHPRHCGGGCHGGGCGEGGCEGGCGGCGDHKGEGGCGCGEGCGCGDDCQCDSDKKCNDDCSCGEK